MDVRSRTLRGCGVYFQVSTANAVGPRDRCIPLDTHAARALFFAALGDPTGAHELRRFALREAPSALSAAHDEAVARLLSDLAAGRIQVLRTEGPRCQMAAARPVPSPRLEESGPDVPAEQLEAIALRVVDVQTALPISGVELEVILPDHRKEWVKTDPDGRTEVRQIKPGRCEIRSVADGKHHSRCYTVVRVRQAPPAAGMSPGDVPIRPPASACSLVEVVRYTVRDGDTWDTIAADHGLEVAALKRFNFDTEDPAQLRSAMAFHVGCKRRHPDTRELIFSGQDRPGILLIPGDWSCSAQTGLEHTIHVQTIHLPTRDFVFST